MSKADNLLAILWLLKSGRRMTAKTIADRLEMHVRTVYRYIDTLCASGVPIIADSGHNGGYRLLRPTDETLLFFDLEEQKALVHAAQFAEKAGYPYEEALTRAVAKLKRFTNENQLDAILRHESGLNVIPVAYDHTGRQVLKQIETAVADESSLRVVYSKDSQSDRSEREIDPYGLVHWKNKWYVVGFCHLRGEIRSFRTERIVSVSPGEARFERPPGFSAREFFLRGLLPDFRSRDELAAVRIAGRPSVLDGLCEHWLVSQGLTEKPKAASPFKFGRKRC